MRRLHFVSAAVMAILSAPLGAGQLQAADAPAHGGAPNLPYRDASSTYLFRASDIIGSQVRNAVNETIGEVDDLIISRQSNIPLAVISVGGFLGISTKLVAIPYSDLQIDPNANYVYYNATPEDLKALPAFTYNQGEISGKERYGLRSRLQEQLHKEEQDVTEERKNLEKEMRDVEKLERALDKPQ